MIKSPVGEQGWIAKIKISDPAQLANLMDEAAYKKYLESL
jgi:glycine cleavage system H lipoate-binding protein